MACATASKTAWNLPPILVRSRFHPYQYEGDVLGLRCSTHAARTKCSGNSLACAAVQFVVALVLQRRAHRADAARIIHLAPFHLCDDEIEQVCSNLQARTGQGQNVVAQSRGECSDVVGKRMCTCFGLLGECDPVGNVRILADVPALGLQLLVPRLGAFGDVGQRAGQHFAPMLDMKHIAMTRLVAPSRLLSGAQFLTRIGDRVVGIKTLL